MTDSKLSMELLLSVQREDFLLWLYIRLGSYWPMWPACNHRVANGAITRLVKVKAQAGDLLNEAADTLAAAAAELEPTRATEVDHEGVHFPYLGTLVPWNSCCVGI